MSEATAIPDRDEQMLSRLAELDLAAAEKVHAKLMAAEEAAEIGDLARTYQRLARSLRQTLALKARLKREREAAAAQAPPKPPAEWPLSKLNLLTPAVRAHADHVHAAAMSFIERENEPADWDFYETEVYDILLDMAPAEDFLDTPAEVLARRILEILGLPTDDARPAEPGPADPPIQDSA